MGAGVTLRVYQMNVVKSLTPKAREKVMVGVDHPFAWLKLLFSANRCATHYSSNHNFCNFPASLPTGSILNRT